MTHSRGIVDLTSLQQYATGQQYPRVVIEAPETREGVVLALQCLLEILPDHVLPVPVEHVLLADALPLMGRRNSDAADGTAEVPAVICTSVIDDHDLAALLGFLDTRADAYALVVQTDPLFRETAPADVTYHPRTLHAVLEQIDGARWQLTVAGTALPLWTEATRR